MAAPTGQVQLTGGSFVDLQGNVLSEGYLLLELSHDENLNSPATQIVAGLKNRVTLNTDGNIPTNPPTYVYSNSLITPANSYYTVRAFKKDGTEAWRAPQYWTLTTDPTNVGTLIPVNPPGGGLNSNNGLTLQTNEVNNGSQVLLDLHAGTNITLTDNGLGRVTIDAAGSGSSFLASPSWWSNGDGSPYAFSPSGGNIGATADLILWYMFRLPYSFSFYRVSYRQNGTGGTNCTVGFGIYNSTGTTKQASWDSITASSAGTNRTATLGVAVTLSPGVYIFAFGRSSGTSVPNTDSGYATSGSSDNSESWNMGGFTRSGQAANSLTAGALPSSLGALSSTTNMPTAFCQVTFSPT